MAKDTMERIAEAEIKAAEIEKDALRQSDDIINSAKQSADEKICQAEKKAATIIAEKVAAAELEAASILKSAGESAEKEAQGIAENANRRQSEAVEAVIDRLFG